MQFLKGVVEQEVRPLMRVAHEIGVLLSLTFCLHVPTEASFIP